MTRAKLSNFLFVLLICAALVFRFPLFTQSGKDYVTFHKSITDLIEGVNPYIDTLRSFKDKDLTSGGYAYFPGLLYTYTFLFVLAIATHIPYEILWKIPTLLAEIGVAYLIYKQIKPKDYVLALVSSTVWLFHPYLLIDQKYTYTDPIPVLFLLLSLIYLGKDDVLSGAFFALSVIFKPFALFILPIYILLSVNKMNFLMAGALMALVFSIPFMRSINDFVIYLKGALLVHEGRGVTGRPFLFYISYYYKIELFQIIPIQVYTILATFGGWISSVVLYLWKKPKNSFILALVGFIPFYIFTPVLNRTYYLWVLPVFLIALSEIKQKRFFYIMTFFFYAFYSWYLAQWIDGFHITKP